VHRIGRTARASSKGEAITFVGEMDQFKFHKIETLIEKEVPKLPLPAFLGEGPAYEPMKKRQGPPRHGKRPAQGSGNHRHSSGPKKPNGGHKPRNEAGAASQKPKNQPSSKQTQSPISKPNPSANS
jgi:superfamily II DNA/RNA helicase